MFRLAVIFSLTAVFLSYGFTEKERDVLLRIIQGAYQDRVYSVSLEKSKNYLKKAPEDDRYRLEVLKILLYSSYHLKKKEDFLYGLNLLEKEKIPENEKAKFYRLALNLFKEEPDKLVKILKKAKKYLSKDEEKKYTKFLVLYYMKNKKWDKILSFPPEKNINLYRVIALYKTGKFEDVIKETQLLSKFPPDVKDSVLYLRGLSFYKLGNEKKAVDTVEAITFKTPEMIKFLTGYYLKKKKYIYAQRYLKILTLEEGYKDYAYFYLGVIEDLSKNYVKALKYYKKASAFKTEYGKKAKKRMLILQKALENRKFYSVRVILLSQKENAERFIKENNLNGCFVKPYKSFFGVYCGRFEKKEEAEKYRNKLKELGFETVIQKI